MGGGDRQPVDLTGGAAGAVEGGQVRGDRDVRGHRGQSVVSRTADERGQHVCPQGADGAGVAVGLEHLRELVDQVVALHGLVGGQVSGQRGPAVGRGGVYPHIGGLLGLGPPIVGRGGVQFEQQGGGSLA